MVYSYLKRGDMNIMALNTPPCNVWFIHT